MGLGNRIVSVVCAICLAVSFVAAGFVAVAVPDNATVSLADAYAGTTNPTTPFSHEELCGMALAGKRYTFDKNDRFALNQAIYDINETVAGTLRIATFTSVSTQWLPTIIRKFQADYPLVEFDLLAGDYDEITERILSGRVDCGFLTAPVADPLVFHLLYKDPMNVLLPERHPLTRQNVLTLPEIKKEPLVLPTKGSDNDIQAVLNSTRGKTNVRYVLNDDLSVISMVSHGFGITIMPELILRNLNYSLEIRPIDPPQYRAIGIASMPLNRVSVLTKTFIQYLTDPSKIDFNELCS